MSLFFEHTNSSTDQLMCEQDRIDPNDSQSFVQRFMHFLII